MSNEIYFQKNYILLGRVHDNQFLTGEKCVLGGGGRSRGQWVVGWDRMKGLNTGGSGVYFETCACKESG